jgi:uncharacterized protein YutE (UPF0331/DUF86 family)
MTIDELKQYCNDEFNNIDRVMNELFSVYDPTKPEYSISDQAAIGALMLNVYSGIEIILKQMLVFDKLNIEDSPGWHEKVLRKAGEIGILPPDYIQMLSKYLAFRNYFMYTYIFNINWEDMKALVDALKDLVAKIHTEVDEYMQTI